MAICSISPLLLYCATQKIIAVSTPASQRDVCVPVVKFQCVTHASSRCKRVVPIGLMSDNWYGYVHRFIYEQQVTWMEMTCATPFWKGVMLFEIDVRRGGRSARKKHKLNDQLFANEGRIAYRGQIFSVPMDWRNIIDQLQLADLWRDTRTQTAEYPASVETSRQRAMHAEMTEMRDAEKHISLPATGAVLAQRVRIFVAAGLDELNKLLKQATVRCDIVVQIIQITNVTTWMRSESRRGCWRPK